jgi:PAS domain S-box-containing protein
MKHSFISLRPYPLAGPRALALTLLVMGLAALLSWAASPFTRVLPYMVFSVALIACAWLVSFGHALLFAVMAAIFVNYFLVSPTPHFSASPTEFLRSAIWLSGAGIVSFLLGRARESADQARRVLASVDEGFCILDVNWNLLYINAIGAQLAGISKNEITGRNRRSHWEMIQQTVGASDEQQLRRCAAERVAVQFETRAPKLGRWLQVRAYPLAEGISIFFRDVTETKEREERMRSMLDRMATAHRAAQMGTFEWSLKTNELTFSNEAHRNHGWAPEQWDGKFETWAKTLHPEDAAGVLAKIQKAFAEKSEYNAEFRVLWPNGEIHWLAVHGQVMLDDQGNTTGIIGICSDITHRHLEEEALQRSEKLAMAGRLAAAIAHEINNPLEAVTNLIYLLRHDAGTALDRDELLRMADEQLSRVNHIAKQTLGFYRDRSVPEAVDVVQTLEELLSILSSRLNAKQIAIEREYEKAESVSGFRGELRQVFSNLLTNAIDASPSRSRLILRVKTGAPPNGRPGALLLIEVEDFGSGIQPHHQPRVFEPFFTTKPDFGTGLGLWVTRELVEKHGGTIDFRSTCEEGTNGTCFSVVLPAGEISQPTAAAAD